MASMRDPFSAFIGFQWDAANADKNWHSHQVSIMEAEQAFLNRPVVLTIAPFRDESEARFALLGVTNSGRPLFVIFTPRGDRIRVISARPMSRRERSIYDEEARKAESQADPEVQE
jgi:uncharacterized protein